MDRALMGAALVVVVSACGKIAEEPTGKDVGGSPRDVASPSCDEGVFVRFGDGPVHALRSGIPNGSCMSDARPCLFSSCGVRTLTACSGKRGGLPCLLLIGSTGAWVDEDSMSWSLHEVMLDTDFADGRPGSFSAVESGGLEVHGAFVACSVSHGAGCD